MGASAVVFGGIIRGGPDYQKYGDDWTWRIGYQSDVRRPWVAVIVGGTSEEMKHRKAILDSLRALGVFTLVGWETYENGVLIDYQEYPL